MQEEDLKANAQRDETAKALNEAHKKSHEEGGDVELDFDNLAEGTTYKKFEETERTKLAGIETGATKYPDTGEQAFLDADHTKLNGIDTGATDDQTGAEIKAAYEAEANAYTDAKNTYLGSIEMGADVTDKGNVETAGAVMSLSKHFDYGDLNTGSSIEMGSIPAHSYVIRTQIHVSIAFNASGTDVCEIGYTGDPNAYGTETNIESTGIKNPTAGVAMGYSATARTGTLRPRAGITTDATTGEAVAIIEYIKVGAP